MKDWLPKLLDAVPKCSRTQELAQDMAVSYLAGLLRRTVRQMKGAQALVNTLIFKIDHGSTAVLMRTVTLRCAGHRRHQLQQLGLHCDYQTLHALAAGLEKSDFMLMVTYLLLIQRTARGASADRSLIPDGECDDLQLLGHEHDTAPLPAPGQTRVPDKVSSVRCPIQLSCALYLAFLLSLHRLGMHFLACACHWHPD